MTADQAARLTRQLHTRFLVATAPFLAPVAFLNLCLLGLSDESMAANLGFFLGTWAATTVLSVGVLSYVLFLSATRQAVEKARAEVPGARLSRLLSLPRQLEVRGCMALIGGATVWMGISAAHVGFSAGGILGICALAYVVNAVFSTLAGVQYWLQFEKLLAPTTRDEQHRHPKIKPTTQTLLKPRLSWYLPYAFAMFVVCTLQSFALIAYANYRAVSSGPTAALGEYIDRMKLPTTLVGVFLVTVAIVMAYQLGQRYRRASMALQASIDGLAGSKPVLPDWVSTDEFGDLAFGISGVFERLTRLTALLHESAEHLTASAGQLSGSTLRQNDNLARQAAALQETEVTAQEIKQTSLLAAQKTESVLQMADRAEEISRTGAAAVEQSLTGLTDIRDSVSDMSTRIKQLGDRARQIATITTTVKDLADQSNMLALNAAIEAVRSGEHGKGFSVVAREIRALADQSIQATNRVREILQDISDAIRSTVAITERGSERVQSSLVQVQSSGESLRALSGIVRDNAAAVRQIAAAVGQQNTGITEIFEAVKDLSRMMDETLLRVQSSDEASQRVREVAEHVTAVVSQYGTGEEPLRPAPAEAEAA